MEPSHFVALAAAAGLYWRFVVPILSIPEEQAMEDPRLRAITWRGLLANTGILIGGLLSVLATRDAVLAIPVVVAGLTGMWLQFAMGYFKYSD